MISKTFYIIALVTVIGFPWLSNADECERGSFCNMFERILSERGGPFAGVTNSSSSLSNLQFQQRALCELPGAECKDEQRLGCARISNSVLSGVVECWSSNDRNFKLIDRVSGKNVTPRSYDVVANLANNDTDYNLIVAKSSYYNTAVLFNENGEVLADGNQLGCDNFQAAGEGTVACVRKDKKFLLKVDDLEKARLASVKVREVAGEFSVNLCSIALNEVASQRRQSNFISRIFLGKKKTFEGITKDGPVTINTHDQKFGDVSPSCSIAPDSDPKCTSINLTEKGLECERFGALKFVKSMTVTDDHLAEAAKKYVFGNKEIVKMEDILKKAETSPAYIEILRPDQLMGSTHFITGAGATKGSSSLGTN